MKTKRVEYDVQFLKNGEWTLLESRFDTMADAEDRVKSRKKNVHGSVCRIVRVTITEEREVLK